jgi:HTH-type transcriptional regulator/antitoxin HigA
MTLTFDKTTYGKLLAEFQPKVISSEEDYDTALKITESLLMNKNRSPEQTTLLNLFVALIEEYEEKHHPMGEVAPYEILQHLMDARELRQADLVGILGSRGVVSEVVNGKRSISKAQAKALGQFFHVSPALFL